MPHFDRRGRTLAFLGVLAISSMASSCGGPTPSPTEPGPVRLVPASMEAVGPVEMTGTVNGRSPEPVIARVLTADGQPVPFVQVAFAVVSGDADVSGPIRSTDALGLAMTFVEFGPTSGNVEVTASVGELAGSPVRYRLTAQAALGVSATIVSGDEQRGTVGTTLQDSLVVEVLDEFGNLAPNTPIQFIVSAGEGSTSPPVVRTDEFGIARTQWTLGQPSGHHRVTPGVEGVGGFPFSFRAFASPDSAAVIEALDGDEQYGERSRTLPRTMRVRVTDRFGNPRSTIAVRLSTRSGDAAPASPTATTDGTGTAAFSVRLGSAETSEIAAEIPGVTPVVFTVHALPPTLLEPIVKFRDHVRLSWNGPPRPIFEAYELRRSTLTTVDETSELIARFTDSTTLSFNDFTVYPGTTYTYRLFALYSNGVLIGSGTQSISAGDVHDLGTAGYDMVVDDARGLVYVSLPDVMQVAVLSNRTLETVTTIDLPLEPRNMSLSIDGTRLFVAMWGEGSVAVLDLDNSMQFSTIAVSDLLVQRFANDVVEVRPDQLAVVFHGTPSLQYLVELDPVAGNRISTIAENVSFPDQPRVERLANGRGVYIGQSSGPIGFAFIDFDQATHPLAATARGGTWFATSRDGSRVYLDGFVLDATALTEIRALPAGFPAVSADNAKLAVANRSGAVIYDNVDYSVLDLLRWDRDPQRVSFSDGDAALLILSGNELAALRVP